MTHRLVSRGSLLALALVLGGAAVPAFTSPAEARCTWYGPGSGPRPACMGPAQPTPVVVPPPKPTTQIGAVTYLANTVQTPYGVRHVNMLPTPYGLAHRSCRRVGAALICG